MRNFLGQDGFIWWFGIVEDVKDPLKLGRCKVRCIGYHPPEISVEDLPWALTMHSPNTWNMYNMPDIGDWVFGFFLDSTSNQEPAILAYVPGIPTKGSNTETYLGAKPRSYKDTQKFIRTFASIVNYTENVDPKIDLEKVIVWESKSDSKKEGAHGNYILFYDKENEETVVLSSSGDHKIRLNDNKNEKYVSVYSSGGNYLKLDDTNNNVSFAHKDGANLSISNSRTSLYSNTGHIVDLNDGTNKITIKHKGGTQIVIDSAGKIIITAQDDINITSSDITINADNFTLNADNVDINSTGTLDLSGASGSITTTGALNVHASSTLDLQGSTININ